MTVEEAIVVLSHLQYDPDSAVWQAMHLLAKEARAMQLVRSMPEHSYLSPSFDYWTFYAGWLDISDEIIAGKGATPEEALTKAR